MHTGPNYNDNAQHVGDNNFTTLSHLETAIEQIKKTWKSDETLIDILEDLADYLNKNPLRDSIGLEKKLENGRRQDLIRRGIHLKGKFARRVAKNQMAQTEQHVYIQTLAAIDTTWHQSVYPRILAGASNLEIDLAINEEIIKPIHQAIVRFDPTVTTETVSGMVYFLTGMCHLIWEPEC